MNNKFTLYFTEKQMNFLEKMKEETGDSKGAIIRRAVNEFMYSEIEKKIEEKSPITDGFKQYEATNSI